MPESDEITNLLHQAFEGLEDKLREIIDKYNAAVNHIIDWRWVLGPALIVIRDCLDSIRAGIDKVVALVTSAMEHHMPVASLIVQGFNWINLVQNPVARLAHTRNDNLYNWEGPARNAYNDKVTAQNDAINAVGGKANEVSKWLVDIAKTNVEFMTELAKMVTGFLGKLTQAAIDTASVIDIPFAIDTLSSSIGDLVTQSLNILVGIAKRFVETLSKIRDVKALMNDPKLLGGQWPQAVAG